MIVETATDLDDTDRAVLTVFHYEDRPLWEELVHECLEKHRDDLPVNGDVSVQVVEQRVDTLHDDRYLESVIASPDPAAKELVAAYILTEQAEQLF